MKKQYFFLAKSLIIIVISFIFYNNSIFSQTLHLFMIIQEKEIGSQIDKRSIKVEAEEICSYINMDLKTYIYESNDNNFIQTLKDLNVGSDDVIWCYYSGHGRNSGNGWPSFSNNNYSFALTDIYEGLLKKNARLTIAMYDCCNISETNEIWTPPHGNEQHVSTQNLTLAYYLLFKNTSGSVIVCSAGDTQLSYGSTALGGFFTHSFIETMHKIVIENQVLIWQNILEQTQTYTNQMCVNNGKRSQNPKYYFDVTTEKVDGDISEILAKPNTLLNRDFGNSENNFRNLQNK